MWLLSGQPGWQPGTKNQRILLELRCLWWLQLAHLDQGEDARAWPFHLENACKMMCTCMYVACSRRKMSLLYIWHDVYFVVDIFYGGESVSSDQHQSYTCPHCGRLGFTDLLLLEHVGNEHADATAEVVIIGIFSRGALAIVWRAEVWGLIFLLPGVRW